MFGQSRISAGKLAEATAVSAALSKVAKPESDFVDTTLLQQKPTKSGNRLLHPV